MLKAKIDIPATIGSKFILIDYEDWTDFEDKTKILGTKLNCGAVDKFEKFTVKTPKRNIKIEEGKEIQFTNLTATPYASGNYIKVSFKADDVTEIEEGYTFK